MGQTLIELVIGIIVILVLLQTLFNIDLGSITSAIIPVAPLVIGVIAVGYIAYEAITKFI